MKPDGRDSSHPVLGMYHENCRKRIRRIRGTEKGDKALQFRLIDSLRNQAELHEKGSGQAIVDEVNRDFNNHSLPKVGWSPASEKNWERIFKKQVFEEKT